MTVEIITAIGELIVKPLAGVGVCFAVAWFLRGVFGGK